MNLSQLLKTIKNDSIQALKDKDSAKLATLRMLVAEIEKRMKQTGTTEISDAEVQEVISSQKKKLAKEKEVYISVGQNTDKQDAEEKVLTAYLPEQMSEEDIRKEIELSLAMVDRQEIRNPMQYLSGKLKGKADMTQVMAMVKAHKSN